MREIRFRGKRIDNGEWVYGWYVKDWEGGSRIVTEFGPDITHCWDCGANEQKSFKVDPKTVGQYIGEHDKKGVDAYEGDIVKGHVLNCDTGRYVNFIGVVKFRNAAYVLDGYSKYLQEKRYNVKFYRSFEIIGNIYENPELLKGEESECNH
jgi:uncharacterized phage protein (TIGR01671 family)